jgi:nicotinamidase-related amidase
MCVSATARAAEDHGYDSTVVSDATGTSDLPSADGSGVIPASVVHDAAPAALGDRFAAVVTTDEMLVP